MTDAILLLLLLVGLELVLGVDNILVISIFVGRLPKADRNKARVVGLGFALLARVLMLAVLLLLAKLTNPLLLGLSVRDLILLAGGMFLLYKAVTEIHQTVEIKEELHQADHVGRTFAAVVTQIVLLYIVFSIDSVVTAIGLTDKLWVIVSAVVVSFGAILFAARPIGDFILHRPTLKILALAFLITIGVTIFMEGMHKHVPKAYIYLPMGFALFVEMLQLRYETNRKRRLAGRERASGV
jgi:predicted tellurium resistance membrane protein TerC